MKKGIIFDLDGVICFTDSFHYLAWKKLADRENIYFDEIINLRLRGVSRMESLDIILEKATKNYSDEEKIEMATFKNNIYKDYLNKMKPSDIPSEVINTLNELKNRGIKIAIGSSSKNAKIILEKTNIMNLFDEIADGNDITKSKPDPEVFLVAAKKLGLNPSECFVIEDAKAGIDAAKAGGFTSVGIGDASKYSKTDYPINKISEILGLINDK